MSLIHYYVVKENVVKENLSMFLVLTKFDREIRLENVESLRYIILTEIVNNTHKGNQ